MIYDHPDHPDPDPDHQDPTSQAVPMHNNVGLEELNKTDRLLVQQVCL